MSSSAARPTLFGLHPTEADIHKWRIEKKNKYTGSGSEQRYNVRNLTFKVCGRVFLCSPVKPETILKVTVRLPWPLSTTIRNQAPQGGLVREVEQPIPEQFAVSGPCCRELEPSLRTSEQFPLSAPSPDEQLVTETEREEANSGTYNLNQTQIY